MRNPCARFLIQISNDPWVEEEAKEVAELCEDLLTPSQANKLRRCNARVEIGDDVPVATMDASGITVIAGWTQLDPAGSKVNKLLRAITELNDGLLEDNVNGKWWAP